MAVESQRHTELDMGITLVQTTDRQTAMPIGGNGVQEPMQQLLHAWEPWGCRDFSDG